MSLRVLGGTVCALALAAAGLAAAAPTNNPRPVNHPHPAARTTVLPLSEGRVLFTAGPGAYWRPSAADLQRLEMDLPHSLSGYYRQYLGITEGGRRLILINGFSAGVAGEFTGGSNDWHRHAVQVMDGGRAFFHATYDPHTRHFAGPEFNGEA